ncbi:MAG TPA: hypothetical protein VH856_00060 [Steroidobacteraceae bacterium]|jgi:hypothetical protein
MNAKQMVVGTIVGGIVLYALGYVFFDLLLGDFYAANGGSATGVTREAPVVWAVGVGALAYAALMVYALKSKASVSVATGMKTGAIVGCLIWLCADFTLYGITNMSNLTVTIVDPLVEIVRGGIMGAVLGMLLPKLA